MNLITLAHAGHGHTEGASLLHYLFEPAHLPYTVAVAALVVAVAALGFSRRLRAAVLTRRRKQP